MPATRDALDAIVAVVPNSPPRPCGVWDYAFSLAEQMLSSGVITEFVSASAAGKSRAGAFRCEPLNHLESLIRRDRRCVIVLHYSHYGYQSRGVPVRLVRQVRRLRQMVPRPRLVCVFHELFSKGPVLSSSYWLGPLQKALARAAARAADSVLTTNARYAAILRQWVTPATEVARLAMPSAIGEPEIRVPPDERAGAVVIFGLLPRRVQAYAFGGESIRWTAQALGIEHVVDIGPGTVAPGLTAALGLPVRPLGHLEPDRVRAELLRARAGFLSYDEFPGLLAKSTVFASYCAFGLLPICRADNHAGEDGLFAGEQYLVPPFTTGSSPEDYRQLAAKGAGWYASHSLKVHRDWLLTECFRA